MIIRVVDIGFGIIGSHSVAAENKYFKDGAAAKFSRGVDVRRSEAGWAIYS